MEDRSDYSGMRPHMKFSSRLCRALPPLAAQRFRSWLIPYSRARHTNLIVQTTGFTGSWLECRLADIHGYYFIFHGCFDWRNIAICAAVCRRGDTIVEVGANIGTETVSFADIVGPEGRVVALEPDEENFRSLERMVELNGFRQVELHRCAAGAEDGEAQFQPPADRNMSGVGRVLAGGGDGCFTVRMRRLDWWLERGITEVRAVFIDVEGYEPAVLRGAEEMLRRHRPVVVLEASPKLLRRNGWDLKGLHGQLACAGYRTFSIGRFGLEVVDVEAKKAGNWLAIPVESETVVPKIRRMIWRCGWMPRIAGLHPLEGLAEG